MNINKSSRKTKIREPLKIPEKITFRPKDEETKNALRYIRDYLQVKSFSKVVRHCLKEYFKTIKTREAKRKELQKIADLYDLKVVNKYNRG